MIRFTLFLIDFDEVSATKPLFEHVCDEATNLNDVSFRYRVAHHDLVHETYYGRGRLLRF